jgi:hypothetical protein
MPAYRAGSVASGQGYASMVASLDVAAERRRVRVVVETTGAQHPPAHAPLVDEGLVLAFLVHLPVVSGARAWPDGADVAAQRVQDVRLDVGELLRDVAHAGLSHQAERGTEPGRPGRGCR